MITSAQKHDRYPTTKTEEKNNIICTTKIIISALQGRIQDFKIGGALKIIARSGARCENYWGISCENHDFTPKKIIFFPILGWGWGGMAPGAPPPLDPPLHCWFVRSCTIHKKC